MSTVYQFPRQHCWLHGPDFSGRAPVRVLHSTQRSAWVRFRPTSKATFPFVLLVLSHFPPSLTIWLAIRSSDGQVLSRSSDRFPYFPHPPLVFLINYVLLLSTDSAQGEKIKKINRPGSAAAFPPSESGWEKLFHAFPLLLWVLGRAA